MALSETLDEKPALSPLPWQHADWQKLLNYWLVDRLPHALLISGPDGIGKSNLAMCFANYLLCANRKSSELRCGRCSDCHWIEVGTHPDLIQVEPAEAGKAIGIDRIRELTEALSLTARSGRYRIAIIRPADRMNTASANAFLKTLEEPATGTLLILLTARGFHLPATIRSRCQRLEIGKPDHGPALDWLQGKFSRSDAERLLSMAAGAPLKAVELGLAGSLERRNALFEAWCGIACGRSDPVAVAEKLVSIPFQDVLTWITAWTTDMIRLAMAPRVDTLRNPDLRSALQTEALKLDLKQLFRFHERLVQAAAAIDSPLNLQILIESILLDWYSLTRT